MASGNKRRVRELEQCSLAMFGDMFVTRYSPVVERKLPSVNCDSFVTPLPFTVDLQRRCSMMNTDNPVKNNVVSESEKCRTSMLVDQLLNDIYSNYHTTTDYNSCTSSRSHKSSIDVGNLGERSVAEMKTLVTSLNVHVERGASVLVRQLKRRDALRRQQEAYCDVITGQLTKRAPENDAMRFTIQPESSESGYAQWSAAMKMVATLPGGIPPEFRRRLWLALADKHLASRAVDWPRVERTCFSEWAHPADSELGVQIVKDLHRTGCSLFCGEDGQENQALLKRVLLAYARWNKSVGYCQGFNMLAALLLQVTDKCESDALKLMIYLIEGVLPESYFADSLRGLSVDMAVFRELLRTRLPRLSKHLDTLQIAAKDGTTSYEPPLTNVFTMQWFLTLFCNCLPQPTVLRIWDLIMLEGNEVLLRTALAIWQTLSDKILHVRSADEFYCIMGVLTRELLEFNLIDANTLIKAIVTIGSLPELANLREHYTYNINPWGTNAGSYCSGEDRQLKVYPKERLALDISALKKQYLKLKQRQRQAHIIISAAINRQPPPTAPVAMNHLLLGKSALLPAKRLGPPKGSIPPVRHPPSTLQWKDAPMQDSSSSSSDTELCDDPGCSSSDEDEKDERPKTSQLEDNLPSTSDTLMNNIENTTVLCDQTTSKDDEENRLSPVSDIFDNSASASVKPDFDLKKYDVESDDDFDFEQFLQDRVKCLKKSELPEYQHDELEKEEDRINYSRRNSERALQIIQENSMILHRILQYQTRLTPSPPLTEAALLPGSAGDDYCVGDLSRIDGDKRSNSPDLMSPDIHGATKHSPQDENSLEPITPSSHLNNFDVHATSEEAAASVWHESDSCDEKTPSSYAYVEPTSLSSPVYTQVELSPPYTPSSASLDNPPSIPTSLAIHPEVITSTSIISDHYSFPDADELISILPADSVSHGEQSPIAVNLKDESIEFPLVSSISDVPQALFPLPGLLHEIPMQTSIEEDSKLPPPPKSPSHSISLQPSVSTILHSISAQDNDKSPEYGSKYTSILEKSRNLDEKYHTLIGNVENRRPLSFHLDSFEEKSFNYERRSSSENILKTGCQESLLSDGTIGFDVDKQKEAESSRVRPFDGNRYDMSPTELLDSPQSSAPEYDRNVTNRQTTRLSPDVDTCKTYNEDVPSTKSPSKIFNPFPIQVSSRQNKDVAVKLGLYKK